MFSSLENSMIFFPTKDIAVTPEAYGFAYEDVAFEAADGTALHGWWIPADDARGELLFFHGNAGNIGDRLESIAIFRRLGLTVFIIDYRGYGKSQGSPSEEGTYSDADGAWTYMTDTRGVTPERTVMFGRSLGAAVGARLAAKHDCAAVILESAFTSVPDMASSIFPLLPSGLFVRTSYDNRSLMKDIKAPLLIAHSRHDEIIPFSHGRELYELATDPKDFLEMKGGHNDGFIVSGSSYVDGLRAFLDRHLPTPGG